MGVVHENRQMFLARPLLKGVMLCRPSVPLCHAFTSSARHFCLFGRRLSRSELKESFREQLQNALSKNREVKETPRADSIPPRPLGQVLIRGGCFYFMTGTLLFTAAIFYDHKTAQYTFQWVANKVGHLVTGKLQLNALELREAAIKLIWALIGANVAVFLLWLVPTLKPAMCRYFSNSVASKSLCLPMFLSMFSHQNPLHLFLNMYVFKSFAIAVIGLLGPAQFMAMFLTGGLFSGLLSLCHRAFMASAVPSLGANGAICAVIGYYCVKFPDKPLHIIILPMFPFSAKYGLYVLLAFETVCLLRILPGHAGQIGGLLFGMYYAHYGQVGYLKAVWMRFVALQTQLDSATMNVNGGNKSEEGDNSDSGGWTTPRHQQQNIAFKALHQQHNAQLEQQKATDKKHQGWAKTMAEQKEAGKDRIRRNREARERRKAAKSESVEEVIGDDDY
uniref:rhomboid protease n=1 Tax=Globodera rostochiensis TaxID=31243 RepID=A0A914GZC3_GLORO